MIWITPEGSLIRNGINLYPLSEWKYSRGFRFRFYNYKYHFRWSVKCHRFFTGWSKRK